MSLLVPNRSRYFTGIVTRIFSLAILVLTVMSVDAVTTDNNLFDSNFSRGFSNIWKNVELFKHLTSYSVMGEGTNCCVHAVADHSCSALTAKIRIQPADRLILRWRWRIDGVATNGSERDLKRFDHAARVFVAFDTWIGPPRTLNYFWANSAKVGSLLEHPMTGRAEIFVVESGNARAGEWVSEERDVTADWRRAFPGRDMPEIVGIGMLTDSDSLGTRLSADYGEIQLLKE